MKHTLHRLSHGLLLVGILNALSACSLLTIERITDPSPMDMDTQRSESTLRGLEGRLEQQDDLLELLATQVSANATQTGLQGTQISYLATRGPAPATAWVELPPTTVPLNVGGVEIEGGVCCVGGIAGDEIEISVRFNAMGLDLPATEMRFLAGASVFSEDQLISAPWMPFIEELVFTYKIPTNWTGFYIRVQYRDSSGNLSPIYQDDISVEGMPPLTPAPGG